MTFWTFLRYKETKRGRVLLRHWYSTQGFDPRGLHGVGCCAYKEQAGSNYNVSSLKKDDLPLLLLVMKHPDVGMWSKVVHGTKDGSRGTKPDHVHVVFPGQPQREAGRESGIARETSH
jgi:hypothetical protein